MDPIEVIHSALRRIESKLDDRLEKLEGRVRLVELSLARIYAMGAAFGLFAGLFAGAVGSKIAGWLGVGR